MQTSKGFIQCQRLRKESGTHSIACKMLRAERPGTRELPGQLRWHQDMHVRYMCRFFTNERRCPGWRISNGTVLTIWYEFHVQRSVTADCMCRTSPTFLWAIPCQQDRQVDTETSCNNIVHAVHRSSPTCTVRSKIFFKKRCGFNMNSPRKLRCGLSTTFQVMCLE